MIKIGRYALNLSLIESGETDPNPVKTMSQIQSNKVIRINSNTLKIIKSATVTSKELPMLIMVLALDTWQHNGRAIDAATDFCGDCDIGGL